jgi:hypothetical protein
VRLEPDVKRGSGVAYRYVMTSSHGDGAVSHGKASRSCCAVHSAVGRSNARNGRPRSHSTRDLNLEDRAPLHCSLRQAPQPRQFRQLTELSRSIRRAWVTRRHPVSGQSPRASRATNCKPGIIGNHVLRSFMPIAQRAILPPAVDSHHPPRTTTARADAASCHVGKQHPNH